MILDPEKETCFDLRLSEEEALHFTLEAPNRATRDILALTIRAFQYFSLKTPKGKEHDVDYLHYILSQGNRIHSRTLSSLENPLANSNELNANIAEEFPVDLEQSASTSSTIVEHSNSKIFGRRVSQSQSEAHVLSSNLGQKFDDKATETIQEFDDGLERDKDGFIINGDKRRGFTDVDNTIEQDSDDE